MNDITIQGIKLNKKDMARLEDQLDRGEWLVMTDELANSAARTAILDCLWAFSASFLSDVTGLDEKCFAPIQGILCEDANPAFEAMIKGTCGLDYLVEAAINADGRGHFLAGYDDDEVKFETAKGVTLYCYRTN
jgi:hypothetical protein